MLTNKSQYHHSFLHPPQRCRQIRHLTEPHVRQSHVRRILHPRDQRRYNMRIHASLPKISRSAGTQMLRYDAKQLRS